MNETKKNQKTTEKPVLEYAKPVLIEYGDVRDITLGPTPGTLESGAEFTLCERGVGVCV